MRYDLREMSGVIVSCAHVFVLRRTGCTQDEEDACGEGFVCNPAASVHDCGECKILTMLLRPTRQRFLMKNDTVLVGNGVPAHYCSSRSFNLDVQETRTYVGLYLTQALPRAMESTIILTMATHVRLSAVKMVLNGYSCSCDRASRHATTRVCAKYVAVDFEFEFFFPSYKDRSCTAIFDPWQRRCQFQRLECSAGLFYL